MRLLIIIAAAVSILSSAPANSAACAGFTDVDSGSSFCVNVAWLKTHNITLGCTATTYCPGEAVTRLQMAAFLNRLQNVAFMQGGNAFGATAQLGTTDNNAVEIIAGNKRGFRIEPNNKTANVIGGNENNGVYVGVYGATIAGGGAPGTEIGAINCVYAFACSNTVTDDWGTVGGGANNLAGDTDGDLFNGAFGTVAGGRSNVATSYSFVGGGWQNEATGDRSTVAGGAGNTATGFGSAVGGGSGNTASGAWSFVAGGHNNTAGASSTFASGNNANAAFQGCVVFANGNSTLGGLECSANYEFAARADGGYYLYTNSTSGAHLAAGTSAWAVISDRNAKSNVRQVDPQDVLNRLAAIPVSTWRWKSEPGEVEHMGPMAQDFYSAFKLGNSDTRIVTVDADGVALAAIQGLHAQGLEKDARIATLEREMAEVRAQIAAMAH